MTAAARALSPNAIALRRLSRHRLGMTGAVLTGLMVAGTLLGPVLHRIPPGETRPWVGACPPFSSHPDCAAMNTFAVGLPAATTPAAAAAALLEYETEERDVDVYRLVLRRGAVDSIRSGAEPAETLDLSRLRGGARELLPDGSTGRALPAVQLVAGQPPPAGVFADGQRVLILEAVADTRHAVLSVRSAGGRVQAIERRVAGASAAPEALQQADVRGENVRRVRDVRRGRDLEVRHWLGTDELGRDLLARILYGGRISLMVGVVATFVSLLVGVAYGGISGYAAGRADRAMMGAVDVLYAVPFMFLVIILMVAFGRSLFLLFVALGAVQWLTMARIVRGQILSLRHAAFVDAARIGGASPARVLFRHLLPHTFGPVIVYTSLTVPVVIMEESFLAFIGLQVQHHGVALDSWGALISRGVQALGQHGEKGWLLIFPAAAMVLTLLGLNALGDGLRDSFDPKGRRT